MKAKLVKRDDRWDLYNEDGHKIASTLDGATYKLSLKNCQAIERGYYLDELAENYGIENGLDLGCFDEVKNSKTDFKAGFQKAIELLGDKKFSEEDVRKAIEIGEKSIILNSRGSYLESKTLKENYIQSLQQTEWDVEIVTFTEDDLKSVSEDWGKIGRPKLDADGCLILRRTFPDSSN